MVKWLVRNATYVVLLPVEIVFLVFLAIVRVVMRGYMDLLNPGSPKTVTFATDLANPSRGRYFKLGKVLTTSIRRLI
jgi:hypothetical protein